MSKPVIKIDNVSKLYRLGQIGTGTLSHDLKRWWALSQGKQDPNEKIGVINDRTQKSKNDFAWALKDISFDIRQGDTLGIIGKNGAGKSTLLKILSRVTKPTKGNIKIKGRIASLLEVGTGFHPEMTGRENIFMNGAILGMSKKEIASKFDEIVDFAGIQQYVDTPVKRYSSGMYVRLAFAVAAHLESEILIVDEVLAVGDAEFQKKCLGKMNDVSHKEGRTVLFVSHNIYAISEICNVGVLLINGTLGYTGNIKDTIESYLNTNTSSGEVFVTSNKGIIWNEIKNREHLSDLKPDDDINFNLSFSSKNVSFDNVMLDFALYNENNENVIHSRSNWIGKKFIVSPNSDFEIKYKIKSPKLAPGKHYLTIYIYDSSGFPILHIDKIDACNINSKNYFGTSLYFDNVMSNTIPEFSIDYI